MLVNETPGELVTYLFCKTFQKGALFYCILMSLNANSHLYRSTQVVPVMYRYLCWR